MRCLFPVLKPISRLNLFYFQFYYMIQPQFLWAPSLTTAFLTPEIGVHLVWSAFLFLLVQMYTCPLRALKYHSDIKFTGLEPKNKIN